MAKGTGGELPCPLCGEPLEPRASKCKNCGASIPRQTRDSLATLMKMLGIDAKKAQRLYNLGYRNPDELKGKDLDKVLEEEPKIFLCPECGAFVQEKDEKCSRCGAEFGGEAMEIEDYLVREERACPNCGEQIHVGAQTCPHCGKPVAEAKGISLGSTYMCPSCGVTVLEGQDACEVCGTSLSPSSLIASKVLEVGAVACPKCGGTLDPETGICPFCSRPEGGGESVNEERAEVVDEIDKFLGHLAAVPATKGGPKPKPAAVARRPIPRKTIQKRPVRGENKEPEPLPRIDAAEKVEPPSETEGSPEEVPEPEEVVTPDEEGAQEEDVLPVLMKLLEEEGVANVETAADDPTAQEGQKELEGVLDFQQPTLAEGEAEAEVEAALESLEEIGAEDAGGESEVRELPRVKLLKPSYSKLVKAPTAPKTAAESQRLIVISELMLYVTAVGLSLQLLAMRLGMAAAGWGFFILFGMACGLSAGIISLSISDIKKTVSRSWQPFMGTIIALAVPLHWYAGASVPEVFDIVLILAGMALWVPSIMRTRGRTAWLRVWMGGAIIATVMAPSNALGIGLGGALTSALLWVSSGVLVIAGVALSLETRWLRRSIDVSLQKGEEEFRRREFKQSIEDYDRAIEMTRRSGEEDNAAAWYSKGAALVVMGRYEEALKAIDEALEINPNNEVAWVNKGNAMSRMGDNKGALKAFNAALRANPRYEVAWNNKGNALARLGRYRESLKCYDLALQIDSSYRGAWINKGFVLAKIGEYEEAAKCAETVMALGGYAGS